MELEPMKKEIETAIQNIAKQITDKLDSGDAMRYSQAVLNLANVLITLASIPKD